MKIGEWRIKRFVNWRMENQWIVVNRAKLIPKLFPRFRNNGTTYYVWGRD